MRFSFYKPAFLLFFAALVCFCGAQFVQNSHIYFMPEANETEENERSEKESNELSEENNEVLASSYNLVSVNSTFNKASNGISFPLESYYLPVYRPPKIKYCPSI